MIINKNNLKGNDSKFAEDVFNTANRVVTPFLRDYAKKLKEEAPGVNILSETYNWENGSHLYLFKRSDTGEGICAVSYNKNHQPTLHI